MLTKHIRNYKGNFKGEEMSEQFNATVNLTTEVCIFCGVVFTLPCAQRKHLLKSHNTFYCPNGHGQVFSGKSNEEELEQENIELADANTKLESSLKYYKARANKVKK